METPEEARERRRSEATAVYGSSGGSTLSARRIAFANGAEYEAPIAQENGEKAERERIKKILRGHILLQNINIDALISDIEPVTKPNKEP